MDIRPLTPERWPDFVDLFERKGPRGGSGPIHCSCMWWRERSRSHEENRLGMERLVLDGAVPGLLAYDEGQAAGWISVAPREQHGQLLRSREYRPREEEQGVWSIVCFYIHPSARHGDLTSELLARAVEHAKKAGARALEAYPHNRGDYMGSPELFVSADFRKVRVTSARTVVRRELPTAPYR